MAIITDDPKLAGWQLKRLAKALHAQALRAEALDTYYRNEAAIPTMSIGAVRQAYKRLMAMSKLNFAELIVEAPRERMNPVGFRTGSDGDNSTDQDAWRIWQANHLDADSALVHRAQLSMADSYVIVGGIDPETGAPVITPEDPRQVITQQDPRRRRKSIAALKLFRDEEFGYDRAFLYLPGYVIQAARKADTANEEVGFDIDKDGWEWVGEPQPLPHQTVPVVRFANRADMFGRSTGEFERHTSMLDRINYQILARLEIATLQAFKQRAVKGVPDRDENGVEIDYDNIFKSGPDALWIMPAAAEMWESGEVNLDGIRLGTKDDVQNLAAVTRTPLFYLNPDMSNGSAEGASLAREGLVFKTEDLIASTGESWEQVMSLAILFAGGTPPPDMQVLWAPAERFSLAERYDAASKASGAGVPWREVMSSVLQFSPQEIDRMEAERASDLFLNPPPVNV